MNALRILIVDDHPINLKLLRAELETEGHTVLEAANGAEALALLDRERVDVVVSDILMPVMDGYRLCYEIRRSDRHRNLAFIAYTATYLSPSDEKLTLDLGADKYIRKPAPIEELTRAIREALSNPRRQPTATIDDAGTLKEYSERLVRKLEEKNIELGRANERLELQSAALATTADAIVITDANGVILWINPAFTTVTGYTADEAIGQSPRILKSGAHSEAFYRGFWQTIRSGRTWRGEFTNRRKDGSICYDMHTVTPVRDAHGTVTHFVGIMHDVTDRKRAENELRESERRIREMLDNLQLVSIMLDRDGRVLYCNGYFLELTGWRRQDVEGGDWFDRFVPDERRAELRAVFAALLAGRREATHFTNEIVTRSGERRLMHWNNSVLRSPTGEAIGTASVAEDITERRKLEEQVLRAQRMESIGTLAGGIAHDLNNLFMPILMGAEMIRRLPHLNESSLRAVDNIQLSVKRGKDLVKQVLLFARGSETARRPTRLADIVEEIRNIIASTFPKNVIFLTTIPDVIPPVMADPTQLNQVLLNLCVNARDAMPSGGQLTISASKMPVGRQYAATHGGGKEGSYVLVEVADTGMGMPRDVLDRIFEPFFTTKEIGQGTGLGLSTVQGIVRSHGGFIDVSSEPGKGSIFRVFLPTHAEPAAVADTTEGDPFPRGHGEVILVVDDEASIRTMTSESLEAFGYAVLTAENGAEALSVFARERATIAAIVTDVMMPIMDGVALAAEVRRADPALPIVATSGGEGKDMERAMAAGASHFLSKPYTIDLLLNALSQALRKKAR